MASTRIFVSSTCYDLSQVRADLEEGLREMGHDVLLSEHASFPISPSLDLVANCKKVVREHADVFVLVVGGRRGSADRETGKSVTNAEYDTAVERDALLYVFVDRDVRKFLSVWEKSPDADFSSQVDDPAVFKFISTLQANQHWIFPFDKAQDIMDALKAQLSSQLRELLDKRALPEPPVPMELQSESVVAKRLVRDRPADWEHLLAAELLTTRLAEVERRFHDINGGTHFKASYRAPKYEAPKWFSEKCTRLMDVVRVLQPLFLEMTEAFGPLGQPGDAVSICRAARKFEALAAELAEWEADTRAAKLDDDLDPLREEMVGWAEDAWGRIQELRAFISAVPDSDPSEGVHRLTVVYEWPDNFRDVIARFNEACA